MIIATLICFVFTYLLQTFAYPVANAPREMEIAFVYQKFRLSGLSLIRLKNSLVKKGSGRETEIAFA